jgi:predicted transcriptional regulator of viral defense system
MARARRRHPDWDRLFEVASAQEGLFATAQAAEAGYSPQLLQKHLRAGRVSRVRRGVYRLVHFPPGEHEDLAAVWLWTERAGVFSHETALSLLGLSDALPAQVHVTVPASWQHRRLRVPSGVSLAFDEVTPTERTWAGAVPVTSARRTLADCAAAGVSPELVATAVRQARARGLVASAELPRRPRRRRVAAARRSR